VKDTHVWRITKSLGWVPGKASREETYEHLNTRIPDDIK
jgi:endonuclease III